MLVAFGTAYGSEAHGIDSTTSRRHCSKRSDTVHSSKMFCSLIDSAIGGSSVTCSFPVAIWTGLEEMNDHTTSRSPVESSLGRA
jgi:hypothetical protein